jgi:hypothetical protein
MICLRLLYNACSQFLRLLCTVESNQLQRQAHEGLRPEVTWVGWSLLAAVGGGAIPRFKDTPGWRQAGARLEAYNPSLVKGCHHASALLEALLLL